ncbi:MAG: TIR domain-containing protein [Hyphomicrobiales bacterium]|nr:TIR domain-containing protein [Hyphomicrobiales bacterium]
MSHKCFISYHKDDKTAVDDFCNKFSGSFIRRGLKMEDDLIDSTNTDYVMKRIRLLYLGDSTVTIVLIGKCTWARRFVDWEVQSSLRNPADGLPNGVVAIQLWDSYQKLPERVAENVEAGYSKFYTYPKNSAGLSRIIDEAFAARTGKSDLIVNKRDRFKNNRSC